MTMETESAATESGKGSNRLIILLDEIEKRVENLRKQALSLEKERGDLLECLHTVSQSEDAKCLSACDREELEANALRLTCRCLTVNISVTVPRNESQEESLKKARNFIESVQAGTKKEDLKRRIQSLINASTSEPTYSEIPPDQKFQALLLGCAAEDQKCLHRHLVSLYESQS